MQADFSRHVVRGLGLTLLAAFVGAVLWLAFEVLWVVFAGILLGIFIRALSDPLARHTALSPGWALTLVLVVLMGLAGLACWGLGPGLVDQVEQAFSAFPEAAHALTEWASRVPLGRRLLQELNESDGEAVRKALAGSLGATLRWVTWALTIGFVGLFVAIAPGLYVEGLLRLLPVGARARGRAVLQAVGHALRWFLIGRALAMLLVAALTALVLMLLGVPMAALLALVAGLLTFAPYVGPILGGVPIALVALADSPLTFLWALTLYTAVQWLEGYLFTPIIQQRTVSLAPAVTLVSQVLGGLLWGGLGVALATPLAAALLVLVRMLYIEDVLGDRPASEARKS